MIFLFIFLGLFLGLALVGNNVIILSIVSAAIFLYLIKKKNKKLIIAYSLMLALGVGLSFVNLKLNPNEGTYVGIVIESKDNYYIVLAKLEKLIVYENNNAREVGDIVRLTGNITDIVDTSLESEFSFTNYLSEKGITRVINVSASEMVFTNFIRLKAYKNFFLSLFDTNARDYVDALLFNSKNYESSTTMMMSGLNVSFLFSTSGIYLSLIFHALEYLFFLKLDKKKSKLFTMILLSWYLVFAFSKVGVRRIVYIKIFSYLNEFHLKKKYSYLEVISLVGIMMLSLNPYLARQSGFYLGYMISLAFYFARTSLSRGKKRYLSLKTSVFAFLLMLPVSLTSGYEFHLLGLLIQTILMPYSFIYLIVSLVSFYSYPIKPLFNFMSDGLTNLLRGLNYIDVKVPFKESSAFFIAIYYVLLFLGIYYLESYSKKKVLTISVVMLSLLIIKITPYERIYANSITFLNVGQGDSAIIRYKDKVVMIDTGGLTYKDIATNVTIPYLHKKGINKVDYVFISHSDYDHMGALASLKENIRIDNVIDTSDPFSITISDLTINNINKWADSFIDTNDKSQVLTFKVADKNILMMGDASVNIEKKIMEEYPSMDIDVLKIGHHGSNTSSSYEFLKFINPDYAIISVGKNNKYHHPSEEVITSLTNLKIPYLRTDEVGSVSFYHNAFLKA